MVRKNGGSAGTVVLKMIRMGLILIGLGCAPIYPCVIHSTPSRFGRENSQSLTGLQMAAAYTGSTFMPKLFGVLSDVVGISLFPAWILVLLILMIVMSEWANRLCGKMNTKSMPDQIHVKQQDQ